MSAVCDSVFLIDDFHPATSRGQELEMRRTLETLIRFFGDGIGKSRATSSMDVVRETKPHGMCAITGEDTSGSLSSLLRCVLIGVEPNTFCGKVLQKFQDDPDILPTHYFHFLQFIEDNYDEIKGLIAVKFKQYRQEFTVELSERRLADAGAALTLIAEILGGYAQNVARICIDMQLWRDAIRRTLATSEII